ncbi:MAG: major capsid protein [Microviridae sp.]|nr:MAG: major capsid protein [Microviridae sp.]
MHNKSIMQHAFSRVPKVKLPRSVFDRSHAWKGTFDADYLIPFYVDEALPGDTFNLRCSLLVRMNSPFVRAPLDNLYLDTFFFFVPNRLLWTNFKRFMGEQDDPSSTIAYTVPTVTGPNVGAGGIPIGHLYDYMGLPVGALSGGGATTGITFANLHGRAYNQIWVQFFKDQNLQNAVTQDLGDSADTFSNYNLLKRGKRHDYFTSCLPYTQKGSTAVSLPLGTSATIYTSDSELVTGARSSGVRFRGKTAGAVPTATRAVGFDGGAGDINESTTVLTTSGQPVYPSNLYADLSTATSATLNSLRDSVALQHFLERDARGGTRYPELISSHFGVSNPDFRVQRPELLSTSSQRLNITPVAQTTPKPAAGTTTDQGFVAAFGTGQSFGPGFSKSFTEHGVLLGLCSVRADITYQQGMDRMWSRSTRYDFFWPTFANIGERAVKNREIYANLADGTGAAAKDGTFGYLPPYEEYRFKSSKIVGNLRSYNGASANANTLDVNHFSESFSSQPTLGSTFIQSSTPLDRTVAVPSADHFVMDAYIDLKCARVMPVFGVPGLFKL